MTSRFSFEWLIKLLTRRGHSKCGVNSVAKLSADILFCATWLAVRWSSFIKSRRRARFSVGSNNNMSWSALSSLSSSASESLAPLLLLWHNSVGDKTKQRANYLYCTQKFASYKLQTEFSNHFCEEDNHNTWPHTRTKWPKRRFSV